MTDKSNPTLNDSNAFARHALKGLSHDDFLNFGMQDIAYTRAVEIEGQAAFAIHAADGTLLSVVESAQDANMLLEQNDLEPTLLH